jgi:hypothetical protein
MDTQDKLKKIGLQVFNNSKTGQYPDCFEISEELKNELISDHDYDEEDVSINEYIINDDYRHYVVNVRTEEGSFVVDCSFGQFSNKTNTNINLGNNVDDVVVVRENEYIFGV